MFLITNSELEGMIIYHGAPEPISVVLLAVGGIATIKRRRKQLSLKTREVSRFLYRPQGILWLKF